MRFLLCSLLQEHWFHALRCANLSPVQSQQSTAAFDEHKQQQHTWEEDSAAVKREIRELLNSSSGVGSSSGSGCVLVVDVESVATDVSGATAGADDRGSEDSAMAIDNSVAVTAASMPVNHRRNPYSSSSSNDEDADDDTYYADDDSSSSGDDASTHSSSSSKRREVTQTSVSNLDPATASQLQQLLVQHRELHIQQTVTTRRLMMQLIDTLDKPQLARLMIHCYPFVLQPTSSE